MTSPLSHPASEAETAEVHFSTKIFATAIIGVCIAVVIVVFWKASFDFGLFADNNPAVDSQLFTAPMPALSAQNNSTNIEASLPLLSELPAIDEGNGKYTSQVNANSVR